MCGIVGKIRVSGAAVQERDIHIMTKAISHRGPDDNGSYISADGRVGLGHARLSIIDLSSAGHQPMAFGGRYQIVFNGEIYNYQIVRQALQQRGYRFASDTDTEVILALYDAYGEDCLAHMRGMFAFAIYDERERKIFFARDRVGKKPFKYFWDGHTFLFASELKALLTQPEYKREPDFLAIHHYLTYQYCPAPWTGFCGIAKLEPGHCLTLDIHRRTLTKKRYWQLSFNPKKTLSENDWKQAILEKLDESVRLRMIADVPLGAFLSGGVDSSAVVASMARQSARPVKTFSIGFAEKRFNELHWARKVAKLFDCDHTEFLVEPEALEVMPLLARHYEEPYADSSAIPTYYLSKLTRGHVTVALNGDGGDENFAGYSRYNFQKLALYLDRMGARAVAPALAVMSQALARRTTFWNRAERFWSSFNEPFDRRYVNYVCYFTNAMKDALYTDATKAHLRESDSRDVVAQAFAESEAKDKLDQTLYADIRTYLPEDLLVKVDIASMAVSLEARSPLLDHEFMELAARMPFSLKLRGWRKNKYIFKEALADRLPPEILHRPKKGFMVPIETWFRGDLKGMVADMLLSSQTRITEELFKPEAVRDLVNLHTLSRVNMAPSIWALLMLELWWREFFPK